MDKVTERHEFFDALSVKTASIYSRVLNKLLPYPTAGTVYTKTCGFIPGVRSVEVSEANGLFQYATRSESFWFPGARIPANFFMMSMGYKKWLREKYRCPAFVEVEAGDCVVDCGGFVGGFATSIAEIAGVVHVVEPSPQNFGALLRNIADLPNVHAHNIGLFDRDSTLTLNLSTTFVDDSFLSPDAGATGRTAQVRVRRVDEWARELGLERIDFMKVEAEGVETEIVTSIGSFPVGKIAVDCSPERDGVSNLDEIAAHLEAKGFAVTARGWMLFARPRTAQSGRAAPESATSAGHSV
jgi:FkbM family methyltransferase